MLRLPGRVGDGWFVRMNNTGGTVEAWAVDGIDRGQLVESPEGHFYVARPIPPERLSLVRCDIEPRAGAGASFGTA